MKGPDYWLDQESLERPAESGEERYSCLANPVNKMLGGDERFLLNLAKLRLLPSSLLQTV
jgi:hypothetical protein